MATEKPRYSITIEEEILEKVENYQTEHGIATRSGATVDLLQIGINEYYKTRTAHENKKSALSDDRTQKLATQFYKLDEHGKVTVECVAKVEESRMQEQADDTILTVLPITTISDYEIIELPLLLQSRSAGPGDFADDETAEKVPVHLSDITRRADYLVKVDGKSMEPDYPDGCIVAVRRQENISIGEVGVFVDKDASYIKLRGKTLLESINPDCEHVKMSKDTVCRGLVLGIVE